MSINRNNYELYFIDYLDGNLPDELAGELLGFLALNPDLANELKEMEEESLVLSPENEQADWSHLKKETPSEISPFETACIDYIEGNMQQSQLLAFNEVIKNDLQKQTEFNRFSKTILTPDLSLVYPDKNKLKKRNKAIWLVPLWSAAAVVLIAFSIWFALPRSNKASEMPSIENQSAATIDYTIETPEVELPKAVFAQVTVMPKTVVSKTVATQEIAQNTQQIEELEILPTLQSKPLAVLAHAENHLALMQIPVSMPENSIEEARPREFSPQLALENPEIDFGKGISWLKEGAIKTAKRLTNDKIDYQNNDEGEITRVEFSSRVLAFSFPVSSSNNE